MVVWSSASLDFLYLRCAQTCHVRCASILCIFGRASLNNYYIMTKLFPAAVKSHLDVPLHVFNGHSEADLYTMCTIECIRFLGDGYNPSGLFIGQVWRRTSCQSPVRVPHLPDGAREAGEETQDGAGHVCPGTSSLPASTTTYTVTLHCYFTQLKDSAVRGAGMAGREVILE